MTIHAQKPAAKSRHNTKTETSRHETANTHTAKAEQPASMSSDLNGAPVPAAQGKLYKGAHLQSSYGQDFAAKVRGRFGCSVSPGPLPQPASSPD